MSWDFKKVNDGFKAEFDQTETYLRELDRRYRKGDIRLLEIAYNMDLAKQDVALELIDSIELEQRDHLVNKLKSMLQEEPHSLTFPYALYREDQYKRARIDNINRHLERYQKPDPV